MIISNLLVAALSMAPGSARVDVPVEAPPLVAVADARQFPLVDQLHETTSDGHASENAKMNCVPTSVAAAMTYLLGRHYDGDLLKHAVYGTDYVGLTSPGRFVEYAKSQGVALHRLTAGSQLELVARLKELLARGVPVLVAMPAAWKDAPANPRKPATTTHVGVAVSLGPRGQIRVMNPWGGFWQDGDDAYWAARLCYGELWSLERLDQAGSGPHLVERDQREQHEAPHASAAAAPTR